MAEPIVFSKKNVSIFQNRGMNPGTVSRQAFIDINDVNEIPASLFTIKVSQSKKAELAGKPVFKHFRFKIGDGPLQLLAPGNVTPATSPEEVKQLVVDKFGGNPEVKFQVVVNVNGKFSNINTPDGRFTIFDDTKFPSEDLLKRGRPGYYLNNKAEVTVTLTPAKGNYGTYYQVDFSTEQAPDDIFIRQSKSKVWGEDDDASTTPDTSAEDDSKEGGIW